MERTVYLLVAYDGTDFHGWQSQPGVRTVQTDLEAAVQRVVRHPVNLIGCGRTDTGVHAAGHVDSFTTTCTIPADRLRHAIGSRLEDDLAILHVRDVHPEFNARRSAVSKLYRYRIHNRQTRPVEQATQRYAYHYWHDLDVERMRAAACYFIGEMDFTAMTPARTIRESMVREVIRCRVERYLDEIRIDVEGTGFLYRQVRNMVGTLIEVGRGRWNPEYVGELLANRDRSSTARTAPGHGLCLRWVRYPPHLLRDPASNPGLADEEPEHDGKRASV